MNLDGIKKEIKETADNDVWSLYAFLGKQLRERGLVRTRNIVGERGEFLAIETYNKTPGLPNLQAAPEGTQNVDAISRKGERYSIKTISEPGRTTGVFYGLAEPGSDEKEKKFEYVIIVLINKDFEPVKIVELNWNKFLQFKRWHARMRAWNLSLTRSLLTEARVIFPLNK